MIIVALGANIPAPDGAPPLVTLRRALGALAALPGLELVGTSRAWSSAPVPPSAQPRYLNAVASLVGTADPVWLLGALQGIEAAAGRRRSVANAPRPLDLDIIDLDGLVRSFPDPVLPHPRAHQRGFVLRPLAELVPDWTHPATGAALASLTAALPAEDLVPIGPLAPL